jgi:hypothetical protein
MSREHGVLRAEWQREGGVLRCAIVCECHWESRGANWAEAGACYDLHIACALNHGDTIERPREFDGDPVEAWREWARSVRPVACPACIRCDHENCKPPCSCDCVIAVLGPAAAEP